MPCRTVWAWRSWCTAVLFALRLNYLLIISKMHGSIVAATIPCVDEPAWTTGGPSQRVGSGRKVNTDGYFGRLPEVSENSPVDLAVLLCVLNERWLLLDRCRSHFILTRLVWPRMLSREANG